jgi:hypothetical protein
MVIIGSQVKEKEEESGEEGGGAALFAGGCLSQRKIAMMCVCRDRFCYDAPETAKFHHLQSNEHFLRFS